MRVVTPIPPPPVYQGLVLRPAAEGDLETLRRFLYEPPKPVLRTRTIEELGALANDGHLLLVEEEQTRKIVAACYLQNEDASTWEFGGVLVKEPGWALMYWMGLAAIVNAMVDERPATLIAHVKAKNDAPRSSLERLGFAFDRHERFRAAEVQGLEHMEVDAEGYVEADTFVFESPRLCDLLDEAINFSGWIHNKALAAKRRLRIDIDSLNDVDGLKGVLADLCVDRGGGV